MPKTKRRKQSGGGSMTAARHAPQAQVAAFIRATLRTTGQPPSYAMIRRKFGYADNTGVRQIVLRLEAKGIVKRNGAGRERRIQLVMVR